MQQLTAQNLESFLPSYPEYVRRRRATAKLIGVESLDDLKDFRPVIELWNKESAIGYNKYETNVLSLILREEEMNQRFDNNHYIDPAQGGNGGEHPIFIGYKNDDVRDKAGYGVETFKLDEKSLEASRISQMLHSRAAFHDIGEICDISLEEANKTGAKVKEPEEEALVGPFKILLASYALSIGDPSFYTATMRTARLRLRAKKQELYAKAMAGKMTGDEFVRSFGHEIKDILDETTQEMTADGPLETKLKPHYAEVKDTFTKIFEQSQDFSDFDGALFNLMDKMEGDAHYRHFIGRPSVPHGNDATHLDRMFSQGKCLNWQVASSDEVIGKILYSQKTIPAVLEAAESLPAGPKKDVALAFARTAAAELLRNHIRMLQAAPPWVEIGYEDMRDGKRVFIRADKSDAKLTADPEEQRSEFILRLEAQRKIRDDGKKTRKEIGRETVTRIEGKMDTQTLITVLDKAANAIQSGKYKPTKAELPLGLGELPLPLHVSHQEIVDSTKKHPMNKVRAFAADAGVVRL